MKDLKARCEKLIGPLHLFDKNTEAEDRIRKLEDYQPKKPFLTLNEEIRNVPNSMQQLLQLVKRRLIVTPDIPSVSVEDQQNLVTVLLGEVVSSWPSIRNLHDDAFLDANQNQELNRRIVIHIVSVCEQLFQLYKKKAEILNQRGVFTSLANQSRLKAQLAVDAHQFLDVPTARRYIAQELRTKSTFSGREYDKEPKLHLPLTHQQLVDISRPPRPDTQYEPSSVREHIADMARRMPELNKGPIQNLAEHIPDFKFINKNKVIPKPKIKEIKPIKKTLEQLSREKVLLKRSNSLPSLSYGETLLEELGIDDDSKSTISLNETKAKFYEDLDEEKSTTKVKKLTVNEDLHQLIACRDDEVKIDEEDDMPPLLRVCMGQSRHPDWKEWQKKQLDELNEREKKRREAECIKVSRPSHPQPDTVTISLPQQPMARYSDVRISERNCLSCFALQSNPPLYNDLLDEIDQLIIKKLDSMLFLGEEITEVYKELERTMPTDHLLLTNDPLVIPAAELSYLQPAKASTTLLLRKQERLINQQIMTKDMPINLPENYADTVKRIQTQWAMQTKDKTLLGLDKIAARDHAIWWATWKTLSSAEDFFTYLTMKETDYLAVVHHLFEENDDEEEGNIRLGSVRSGAGDKSALSRLKKLHKLPKAAQEAQERDEKVEVLRREKSLFTPGLWNVNTILMGGLGNEPELEETEPKKEATPPPDLKDLRNQNRSKALVISRRSLLSLEASGKSIEAGGKSLEVDGKLLEAGGKLSEGWGKASSVHQRDTPTVGNKTSMSEDQRTLTRSSAGRSLSKVQQQPGQPNVQQRLERVWDQLQVPDKLRLDHAIKYSSDNYFKKLETAVGAWEDISELILEREALLLELEKFEITASDPHRFFQKGIQGSSKFRMKEAKVRQQINEKIDALSEEIRVLLEHLKKELQDEITYRGRPYLQKMQWDRTEMLYWLQEDRKRQLLERVKSSQKFLPTVMVPLSEELSY